jgi:hypothetical protein
MADIDYDGTWTDTARPGQHELYSGARYELGIYQIGISPTVRGTIPSLPFCFWACVPIGVPISCHGEFTDLHTVFRRAPSGELIPLTPQPVAFVPITHGLVCEFEARLAVTIPTAERLYLEATCSYRKSLNSVLVSIGDVATHLIGFSAGLTYILARGECPQ